MAYQEILGYPIMKYETVRRKLEQLIRENESDSRKGIVNILNQARKKLTQLDQELARVRGMMTFEEKYSDHSYICGIDEGASGGAGPYGSSHTSEGTCDPHAE